MIRPANSGFSWPPTWKQGTILRVLAPSERPERLNEYEVRFGLKTALHHETHLRQSRLRSFQSLCEGCKSRHATESAYTTKRALQWLAMRVQKRQRRVFARRQMHCIWRARRKRKRRPCHHVDPPSAVQPGSRQDEGYGATHLSVTCPF
jgi:hypothetical protein